MQLARADETIRSIIRKFNTIVAVALI